jgi:hypothetical protein
MSSNNATSPQMMDLTTDNISKSVKEVNSQTSDPRLKFLMEKLVDYLHDYVRETCMANEEWTIRMCNDVRQEFILLSDILGVSALLDALSHPLLF